MDCKQGLREILDNLYCRGLNDARPDYYKATGKELTRKQAEQAIIAYLRSIVPEKYDIDAPSLGYKGDMEGRERLKSWRKGYNTAVDELVKRIEEEK